MSIGDASEVKNLSRSITSRLKQEREQRGWTQSEVAERIGSTRINVGRWENGITVPSPYYRQKLGELFGKSIAELGLISKNEGERGREEEIHTITNPDPHISSSPVQPIWSVPYRRNPFFTGREEILVHLYTVLRSSRTAALTQPQAISGLGGIGKTQIALEYAYRYYDYYQAIFWVNASTREVLNADFASLATVLDLPEKHEQDQDTVIRAVKRWLANHTQWLLILDNVDTPEMIVDFLPAHIKGDVLITTRQQALGTVAQSIEVEKMGQDESMMFLLHRINALALDASLDRAIDENKAQAIKIIAELDGLPLALDQAGAYIEETRCGLSQYHDLYATRRKELLLRRGRFPINHPDSVATTWSLSFQKIEQENPSAADLLRLLTFLDPDAIPEEIIIQGATELGSELAEIGSDPLKVNAIIELLLSYSLIRRTSKVKSLSIHRLVQVVLKDGMDTDTQRLWAERAIRVVNRAFPDVELHTWESCQRCLPHAQICATYMEEYAIAIPEAGRLFNEAATYLMARGSYERAKLMLLKALAVRQEVLGANHPDTACTLNDLGVLYQNQGKYQEAEPLLQKALEIRQQVPGEEHPDVAETFYNLGNLYRAWRKYVEAEPFYLHALHIRKFTLGTDDPLVASSYYGLSKLYYSQEKYEQAEEFCTRALKIQEQCLENRHPALASTLIILAKIYQRQHKLKLAEEMNMRALYIRENASGKDDLRVATIANNLAEIYHAEGRYHEAGPWIERALSIHKQTLGWEHPYMAYSLNNLAENFFMQGDYGQAETYYKKALAIRERTFGPDHSTIISTLEHYSITLRKLKRESESDEVEARIQAIREKQAAIESP